MIFSILLFCGLGVLKGLRDLEMKLKSSWVNKYHPSMELVSYWIPKSFKDKLYKKYHEIFRLKYKENFLFSATLLVFLTDKWHLYETMIFLLIFIAAFTITKFNLITIIFCYVCYTVCFHIFYTLNPNNK